MLSNLSTTDVTVLAYIVICAEAIVKRCSTTTCITWALSAIFDVLKTGLVTAPELSLRQLQGRSCPGGKGILDLLLAKQDVAVSLHKFASDNGFDNVLVTKMDGWKSSINNYRADVGYWDPVAKSYTVNNQWISGLTPANQKLLALWDEVVVLVEHDAALKACKVGGLTIHEGFITKQPMKDRLDAIKEVLIDETGGRPQSTPTSSHMKLSDVTQPSDDDNDNNSTSPHTPSPAKHLSVEAEDKLKRWAEFARQKVSRCVKLHVHPNTIEGVERAYEASAFGSTSQLQPTEQKKDDAAPKFVAVMYDAKLAGAASARAHLRIVPFREQHCKSGVRGVIQGLGKSQEISPRAMFFIMDGFQHGNESKFLKVFADSEGKSLSKEKRTFYVMNTEESLRKRKSKIRGAAAVSCVEYLHVITGKGVTVPTKKLLHSQGTTQSDLLGPFEAPANEEVWRVAHKEKTSIYGPSFVEVGGAVEGDDVKADPAPRPTDAVPLTYWANSQKVYEEMDHAANAIGWVDLTCLDETLAMLCVRSQKPYLGFCPTEKHMHLLSERLDAMVFEAFQRVGDSLYEESMADLVKPVGAPAPSGSGAGKGSAAAGDGSAGGAPAKPGGTPPKTAAAKGTAGGAPPSKDQLLNTLQQLEAGDPAGGQDTQ